MHLTAILKLRADKHDRALMQKALSRWHDAYATALSRARARTARLLRLIEVDRGTRARVNGKALHAEILSLAPRPAGLHSSAHMSLVVALEESLGSWLALHAEWLNGGKKTPKPRFPTAPAGSTRLALLRHEKALDQARAVATLAEENRWRADVTRTARQKILPMYFGAMTSGVAGQAHAGLIERDDGRRFALLTLWPAGDTSGEAVRRARNRTDRGDLLNRRGETAFDPTPRARASIMVPIEHARGHEQLFFARAVAKSAELVSREDAFYLHVAYDYPPVVPRPRSGAVVAVCRGVTTLLVAVAFDEQGRHQETLAVDGGDLVRLITAIRRARRVRQEKGHLLAGDRRQARVAEHHLYSAAHQVIALACRHDARLVLMEDRRGRAPNPLLAYRHFSQLQTLLAYLAPEARLPAPEARAIYGSWRTCLACAWRPGDTVKREPLTEGNCPGCGAAPLPQEERLARLLALDTLRLRQPKDERMTLQAFVREHPHR